MRKRAEKVGKAEEVEAKKKATLFEGITTKLFLNVKEAAYLLGVSERTFFRLMKDGTVKSLKLRGRTIISRADINELFS